MMMLAAFLVFAGCASLALSQDAKWRAVAAPPATARTRLACRRMGWLLLAVALGVCIASEGPGFAVLIWTLQFAVAGFVVALVLGFRAGLLKPLAEFYARCWP